MKKEEEIFLNILSNIWLILDTKLYLEIIQYLEKFKIFQKQMQEESDYWFALLLWETEIAKDLNNWKMNWLFKKNIARNLDLEKSQGV